MKFYKETWKTAADNTQAWKVSKESSEIIQKVFGNS